MSKRIHRVQVTLDSGTIRNLPDKDIKAILRAADELIGRGGRSLLVKILKGSKDKKLLELHLDECPVYGYYRDITMTEIEQYVDWMIKKEYLRIEYNYRLPVLCYSEKGWEIEKKTYAEELFQRLSVDVKTKRFDMVQELKDGNREVIMLLLDIIDEQGTNKFMPFLEQWKSVEVKKVRSKIGGVMNRFSETEG